MGGGGGVVVLVVVSPPVVGRRLRPSLGRVLPALLSPERHEVEEAPDGAKHLVAPSAGDVAAIDALVVAQEDAHGGFLLLADGDAKVGVEVAAERREPRNGPAHAPLVGRELLLRGPRHQRQRHVARVQMGEMADVVDAHRAADAALLPRRAEHDVVDDELAPPLEQVDQPRRPALALEQVVLLDLHHRQAAPFGRQRVAGPGRRLLLGAKLGVRGLPRRVRDDLRQAGRGRGHRPGSCRSLFGVRTSPGAPSRLSR